MDSPSASLFPLTRPVIPTSTVRQLLQFEEPASLRAPLTELLLRRPGTGRILHQFPGRWHCRAQRAIPASSFPERTPEHVDNAAATLGLLYFHRPSRSGWTSYSGYFGQIGRPDRNHGACPRWLCGLLRRRRYDGEEMKLSDNCSLASPLTTVKSSTAPVQSCFPLSIASAFLPAWLC